MGIFGALTTAVTGMRAQAFALENVSGNIANSQTTGFKRVDTTFQDMIPDGSLFQQRAGSVIASSRATNSVQGDIQAASLGTFMAINGSGYFSVQKPASFQDNRPAFEGIDLYTRRGDFAPDKDGYLVNGAGYYLMGVPIDPSTGNLVGSSPQVLQFQNDFLPAVASTEIDYRINLPRTPRTDGSDPSIPGSELLNPANFISNPVAGSPQPAKIFGSGATLLADKTASLTGTTSLASLSSLGGTLAINGTTITIAAGDNAAAVLSKINAQTATTGVTASLDSTTNKLVLTGPDTETEFSIDDTGSTPALLGELGLSVGTTKPTNLLTQNAALSGQTLQIKIGSSAMTTITFGTGPGQVSTMAELNTALGAVTGGTAQVDANGNVTVTANNMGDKITISGNVNHKNFGIQTLTGLPSNGTVIGDDVSAFLDSSIGGGAVTCYDDNGTPVNVQLRWAKTASTQAGGKDTWNLFYQVNSTATGEQAAWINTGTNYSFKDGEMDPAVTNVTLSNLTVDGTSLGDVKLVHGTGSVTQFADANGAAQVNLLQQNGYAAGNLQEIAVNDKGRVVGSYSNGRTIDLAEITLANFNGPDYLKRLDGGAFAATEGSGGAIYGAAGAIQGSALEGSNVDIADEFTKLIVTQQAYSANTRVITTTNQMVQDLMSVVR